jgi:hypothetical protein
VAFAGEGYGDSHASHSVTPFRLINGAGKGGKVRPRPNHPVQAKLDEQTNNHKTTRNKSEALLIGRIFE